MGELKELVLGRKDVQDLDEAPELPPELMTINMGPSHPAMHGTVRIVLTVDGERVKDDGLLEPFEVSLEEAQNFVMTARIMLGWVDPADLETAEDGEDLGEEETEAEA